MMPVAQNGRAPTTAAMEPETGFYTYRADGTRVMAVYNPHHNIRANRGEAQSAARAQQPPGRLQPRQLFPSAQQQ